MPQTISTPNLNTALSGKKTSKTATPKSSNRKKGGTQDTLRGFGGGVYDAWAAMFGDPAKVSGMMAAAMNPSGSSLVPESSYRAADQAYTESSRRQGGTPVAGFSAPPANPTPATPNGSPAAPGSAANPNGMTLEPLIDPLTMQAFFANVLGPYMQQLSGRQDNFIDTYEQQMNQVLGGNLPGQYKNVLRAQVPQQIAGYRNAFNAMQGAAMAAPAYSDMLKRISDYTNATQKAYFAQGQSGGDDGTGGLAQMLMALASQKG